MIKKKTSSIKNKKINVFGIFLILSFLFLVMTKLSKVYTEELLFHIKLKNVPDNQSISSKSDSLLKVEVRAYGFQLLSDNFYRHNLSVNFDKDVQKVDSAYVFKTSKGLSKIKKELGSAFEILSIEPDTLTFPYESMAMKKVPVVLNGDIEYVAGYDLVDSLVIQPDSVNVIGTKENIEKIKSVKSKPLALKDINKNIKKQVELAAGDYKNIKLSQETVKITGEVKKFTEGSFLVPITITNLPKDAKINYFPKTVSVLFYVALENYNNIKALDFKVECDFKDVNKTDKTFFTPKLVKIPEQVKSARLKQDRVEFIIVE